MRNRFQVAAVGAASHARPAGPWAETMAGRPPKLDPTGAFAYESRARPSVISREICATAVLIVAAQPPPLISNHSEP